MIDLDLIIILNLIETFDSKNTINITSYNIHASKIRPRSGIRQTPEMRRVVNTGTL